MDSSNRTVAGLVGGLLLVATLGLGVAWWTLSDAPSRPGITNAERADRTPAARAKAAKGKARVKAKAKAKGKAAKAKRPEAKTPVMPKEERIAARQEFREERLGDLDGRLDAYAAAHDWDPETTEQVREAIVDNADQVSARLEGVARGDARWEEIRAELRQERLDRAASVRRLLGEQEFETFVREMDFARFLGDEPVPGRLEP